MKKKETLLQIYILQAGKMSDIANRQISISAFMVSMLIGLSGLFVFFDKVFFDNNLEYIKYIFISSFGFSLSFVWYYMMSLNKKMINKRLKYLSDLEEEMKLKPRFWTGEELPLKELWLPMSFIVIFLFFLLHSTFHYLSSSIVFCLKILSIYYFKFLLFIIKIAFL